MPTQLSRDSVLLGICHSLGHAVSLISDAALLYSNQRVPSSLLLAVSAREELGKVNILNKVAQEIHTSKVTTVEDVQKRLIEHKSSSVPGNQRFSLTHHCRLKRSQSD